MRQFFATLGCLLIWLSGQSHEGDQVKDKQNQSLLWKITRQDMRRPSYLFGTIHLLCPEDYIWTAAMKKSLAACQEVCFEMDMDDPSVMMEVASGMIDNSGNSLKDYFKEEDYLLVSRFLKDSLGMNILMFQQMKPAALQSLFATKVVNCAEPVSYEANILEEARKLKMDVTGLEDPKEQLALFDSMPVDSVVKDLVTMAKDYSEERQEYRKMLEAYKKQDLPLLNHIIQQSRTEGTNMDAFLDDRNKKWIERMEERMEQKPVFFAVGAGHLLGESGLIQLLRNSGYTVVPVK